jgi:hypothetical protein
MYQLSDSTDPHPDAGIQYRVWILHCEPWDLPPKAIALEPAESECFSASEARDYVAGFNASPDRPRALWAICVPVRMRLDRDIAPGAIVGQGRQLREARRRKNPQRIVCRRNGPRNCA